MVRKWFLLTPAGTLLLLLGLGFQAIPFGTSQTFTSGANTGPQATLTESSHGMPPVFHLTTIDEGDGTPPSTSLKVEWHLLLPMLALLYLGAAAVGRAVTAPGRAWRPVVVILTVLACVAGVAFVVATGISRYYWGYFLSRPSPDDRIVNAKQLMSVTPFVTDTSNPSAPRLVIPDLTATDWTLETRLNESTEDHGDPTYYDTTTRVPRALAQRGHRLDDLPTLTQEQLAPIYARLLATGQLDTGGKRYVTSTDPELTGYVIQAVGPAGEPLLFVTATSDAVSNDHFAYYEFLFTDPPVGGAGTPQLLSTNRFYYDVAGMEGTEWPNLMYGFGLLGGVLALPVTLIVLAVNRWRAHRRTARVGFPIAQAPVHV